MLGVRSAMCPGSSRSEATVIRGASAAARGPTEARGASAEARGASAQARGASAAASGAPAALPPCHPAGTVRGAAEVSRGRS